MLETRSSIYWKLRKKSFGKSKRETQAAVFHGKIVKNNFLKS